MEESHSRIDEQGLDEASEEPRAREAAQERWIDLYDLVLTILRMLQPAAVERVAGQIDALAAPNRKARAVGLEGHFAFDDPLEFERRVPVAVKSTAHKRGQPPGHGLNRKGGIERETDFPLVAVGTQKDFVHLGFAFVVS